MQPFTRRSLLAATASGAAVAALPARAAVRPAIEWHVLADQVRTEMAWAWSEYRRLAWGKDEIRPISGTFSSFPLKTHHLGLSLVEAMDTLWVMGLDDQFADALAWVKSDLDFDVDGEVSVFETDIRLVGGLLSAHHACGNPVLLAKARDLADRLLPAFRTPTGLPYRFVNLKTGAVREPRTNPAEIGTHIAEFGTLSKLTGDPKYVDAAKKAMVALYAKRSAIGLIPDAVHAETGQLLSRRATIAPPSDSYYEYLWDGWDLLGDRDCKRMYEACTAAILKHQRRTIEERLWFVDVDYETGKPINTEQDELSAFYGGLLMQGGAHAIGAANLRAWAWAQHKWRVLPEGFDPVGERVIYKTNSLRPELADGAFTAWLVDRSPEWREIGRTHFLNMVAANKAAHGYADLADVTAVPKKQADHCPGYWWSEQMKYYYLLFSDTPRFDYKRNYLSTEGNVLRGFIRPR